MQEQLGGEGSGLRLSRKQACSMPAPLSKLLFVSSHTIYLLPHVVLRSTNIDKGQICSATGCQRDQWMVTTLGKTPSDVKKILENHAQTGSTLLEGKMLFQLCSTSHTQGYILSC